MSKMRRTLADSVGGTRKTRVNASSSSRVTTPSAIANLAPSAMTAMVKATPGSSGLAPARAPSGPPPSRNPAAAPPNFPQMDMGEANKPILAQLRRAAMTQWKFYIDRGGTFTDVVAEAPDGTLSSLKLLSESPNYDDAALEAIRRTLNVDANAPLPADLIAEVRMGTTVATNALLTRGGERTLLVTTKGLRDQLRIGTQHRPKLFALNIELPDILYERVIEADERVTAEGEVLAALDERALAGVLRVARAEGISACAIVFMHGYRYPAHEQRAARIARDAGFTQISTSHDTVPLMKFVSRGDTTVADAYLSPVLSRHADRISDALGDIRLFFMTSNGGLAAPQFFRGKDAIVSGPAGGVVGMAETAREAGIAHTIGFDMGGTSTDVSRFDGTYERIYETEVAGVRLRAPMMAIHTVAAGGGSILH